MTGSVSLSRRETGGTKNPPLVKLSQRYGDRDVYAHTSYRLFTFLDATTEVQMISNPRRAVYTCPVENLLFMTIVHPRNDNDTSSTSSDVHSDYWEPTKPKKP